MKELQTTQLPDGTYIQRNDKNRVVISNKNIEVLTPTEYRLFCILLSGDIITDKTLVQVFSCQEINKTAQRLLRKHIENTKSKLNVLGLNIHRVYRKGYVLMTTETVP